MTEIKTTKINRRQMLGGTGAAVAGTVALATPISRAEAAPKVARWVMVMDLRRCVGCRACTVSCKAENDVSLGRFRTVIQENTWGEFPATKKGFLPLMCNHCTGNKKDGNPPCIVACPQFPGKRAKFITPEGKKIRYRTGGTYKRPDGIVLIDTEQCIGCGKCIDACPYGVRSFNPFVKAGADPSKQAADKCTMCAHRVDKGVEPSCVNTCQGRARIFGDLNDPESEVSKLVKEHNLADSVLLPEKNTDPHVFYIDPDNILKKIYRERTKGNLDHFMDQIT